jgi:hypothetical protein
MASPYVNMLHGKTSAFAVATAFLVLVGSAVVQGLWTNRWTQDSDLECAVSCLGDIPLSAGPWQGSVQELEAEKAEAAKRAGIPGIVQRRYVNDRQQAVSVILMAGAFGPLSVHTPDVCYGTAGYVILGKPTRVEVELEDEKAEFWTARFHKPNSPETPPLRIVWGWNCGEGWQAPDNPRWTFRREPALYKLYVAREMTSLDEPLEKDPTLEFLRTWLPELDVALFE